MRCTNPSRRRSGVLAVWLLVAGTLAGMTAGAMPSSAATRFIGAPQTPTPISDCADATGVTAAVNAGGSYVFTCSGTIDADNLVVTKSVSLDATGQNVTIYGQFSGRIFDVEGGTLTLTNLAVQGGEAAGGPPVANGVNGVDGVAGTPGASGGGPPTGADGGGRVTAPRAPTARTAKPARASARAVGSS